MIRMRTNVENYTVAIERISSYDCIEQEGIKNLKAQDKLTDSQCQWPSNGIVEYCDYSTQYQHDLPFSLYKISFKTNKFEKAFNKFIFIILDWCSRSYWFWKIFFNVKFV